jgi:hypothetical protein
MGEKMKITKKPRVRLRHCGRKVKDWAKYNSKYHFVDSTSLLAASNPIYAGFEVGVAGMSDWASMKARLIATGLSYFGGMGWMFGKGRNLWRKRFGITDRSREGVQSVHDALFSGAFNLALSPPIYLASGVTDLRQLTIGVVTATAFGFVQGPWLGYSVGVGRDLSGLEKCDRRTYPDLIRRQSSSFKRTLGAGLVATSVGLMSLIYSATPNGNVNPENQQTTTQQAMEISDVVE